ncbi:MAG: hypothetical protein DRI90_04285 [Deltaproteobacteria bacterium]|nr:MAG: hypothetical protein DRI90_04285 [Deltaproteobacteria bacterium]
MAAITTIGAALVGGGGTARAAPAMPPGTDSSTAAGSTKRLASDRTEEPTAEDRFPGTFVRRTGAHEPAHWGVLQGSYKL